MYAIVKISGKQYRICEGEILNVDKLENKTGEVIELSEVLLVKNTEVVIGQPLVSGFKVTAKILDQIKGEKIRISRFKAKVRHRTVKGFRALLTKIQIEKIIETKKVSSVETSAEKVKTDKPVKPVRKRTTKKEK